MLSPLRFISKLLLRPKPENFLAIHRGVYQKLDLDDSCHETSTRGLVLGIYCDEDDPNDLGRLTPTAMMFNNKYANGRITELLKYSRPCPKLGDFRTFFNVDPYYSAVVLVGLGNECPDDNEMECMDDQKEAIRIAAAMGCRELQKLQTIDVRVESFGHAESAAEGAALATWTNDEYRSIGRKIAPNIRLFEIEGQEADHVGWQIGLQKAEAQNLTRQLQDTPANKLTPLLFAQKILNILMQSGVNVEVKVKDWAETHQMNSFLAVAKGSCEPPIFLELSYFGTSYDERPIVLIGQGTTYDSGGLCRQSAAEQEYGRGDMTGAAVVVAACRAVASMHLPVNIRCLIPLCEHIMGSSAMKPGDVVKTMNGKCIEVANTDYEGPLVIVDALLYAKNYFPRYVIDVGTISREIKHTFGSEVSDRVWRLPLWDIFRKKITAFPHVDVTNVGVGSGYTCKSAAILNEFVDSVDWLHMDVYGVMVTNGRDKPYLQEGMAGRPTRTLIEMIAKSAVKEHQRYSLESE
uniref:Cytosol aminopeptidase n=1 Tax=Lutzomyia longipalpis TaxID=7200 RepID=A0A1B0EVM6_LUTLO